MEDQRQQLLDSIRGRTVQIPDLRPIFTQYTGELNPNYRALVPLVNKRLESLVSNEKRLEKLKAADFALFASNWWPHADFNELRIVCFLALWLFLWDDALDEPTGEYADNFEAAQRYRKETARFLADTLGLSTPEESSTVVTYSMVDRFHAFGQQLQSNLGYLLSLRFQKKAKSGDLGGFVAHCKGIGEQLKAVARRSLRMKPVEKSPSSVSHPIIESFRVIGDELRAAYTLEQRQNFFDDLEFYISATETEQRFHLENRIPTLEEYWEVRMGTSAVAACLATIEFTNKIKVPCRSTNNPALKTLSDETNIIVVIVNDILSLKKEIVQGCIDSLIPLSTPVYGGVQQAIDQAHTDLLAAVARFDAEVEKILSSPNTTGYSDKDLYTFINGCRDCWVGNFSWSLCTGRYGLGSIDQRNGTFTLKF